GTRRWDQGPSMLVPASTRVGTEGQDVWTRLRACSYQRPHVLRRKGPSVGTEAERRELLRAFLLAPVVATVATHGVAVVARFAIRRLRDAVAAARPEQAFRRAAPVRHVVVRAALVALLSEERVELAVAAVVGRHAAGTARLGALVGAVDCHVDAVV